MFKKQQKWIAIFVAVTFIWLMQISTMPMAAAGTSEQISSAGSDQGPNFIEGEGARAPKGKGKSILPWILIGVGVVVIASAAVLFLFVLNNYDIRGNWSVDRTALGETYSFTTKFSGEKNSGTFTATQSGSLLYGTYTADKKDVVWTFESGSKYSGTFSDKDTMSGQYLRYDGVTTGTWTAIRTAAATAAPVIQSLRGQLDKE